MLGQRLPASSYVPDPQHLDAGALRLRWRPVAFDDPPDTSNLPPLDYAILLFNTAKFYLGSIAYLIDEKDFLRNLHELYEDPVTKATNSRYWFAVYLLILAYGKVFIVNQSTKDGPAGYQYAVRAMALMPDLSGLGWDAIHAVQALTLGAVYLQSIDMRLGALQHVSRRGLIGRLFLTNTSQIGHALRLCIIEGWHRHMPIEVVGLEHSRRCNTIFWVVYRLDREFGPLMGAPSSIRDEDITARAPSELDDSLDALNMTLHTRLARLMARILTGTLTPSSAFRSAPSAVVFLDPRLTRGQPSTASGSASTAPSSSTRRRSSGTSRSCPRTSTRCSTSTSRAPSAGRPAWPCASSCPTTT